MKLQKEFFSYVIPSLLAFALSGVYAIVDGFFVGNSVGDAGLTTINIAYPVVALLQAAGTGIGMGGAVHFSILCAEGKTGRARDYLRGSIVLLTVFSLLSTVFFFFSSDPLLRLLGARGELLRMGNTYLKIIVSGTVFQVFGTGLVPLIRNMGGAVHAMLTMIAGFVTNILLDYLFVWVLGYSVAGAALATLIGQAVTMAGGILFFLRRGSACPLPELPGKIQSGRQVYGRILRVGLSPFGITFSPNITFILMNRFLMDYGGEQAAACYACIVYVIVIIYLLLQGVGDGSQPLISRYYGAGQRERMHRICSLAYRTAFVIAVLCMAGMFAARYQTGLLFGASPAVRQGTGEILPLFLIPLLFLAFVRVTTSSFYATEKVFLSYLLVYMEPAFLFVLLLTLPPFLGLIGVWISIPISQALTAAAALVIKKRCRTQ